MRKTIATLALAGLFALTGCEPQSKFGKLSDGITYEVRREFMNRVQGNNQVRNILLFGDGYQVVDESRKGEGDLSEWVRDGEGRIVLPQDTNVLGGAKCRNALYLHDTDGWSNALRHTREVYSRKVR